MGPRREPGRPFVAELLASRQVVADSDGRVQQVSVKGFDATTVGPTRSSQFILGTASESDFEPAAESVRPGA